MTTPGLRKFVLTAHITASVGWLGVAGLTSKDPQLVRGAYLAMEPVAWFVLVPLAFASLLTGLVQALGTKWGLFQHYWVLFKLLINVFATVVLLIYMESFSIMARMAADPTMSTADIRALGTSPRFHTILAVVLLLVATVLAVYKPRGMTRYGWRKQQEEQRKKESS
jgi:hypothetical protein